MDTLKSIFHPANRGRIYTVALTLAPLLVTYGVLSAGAAALIPGLVLAVASLVMAFFHSKNLLRKAIYSVVAALVPLLVVLGFADAGTLEALLTVAALGLGIGTAAVKTPNEDDDIFASSNDWPRTV